MWIQRVKTQARIWTHRLKILTRKIGRIRNQVKKISQAKGRIKKRIKLQ